MKKKTITFNQDDTAHLYELALEHFCDDIECFTCGRIKKRMEECIGKKEVTVITKIIKKNGYCNKLIK